MSDAIGVFVWTLRGQKLSPPLFEISCFVLDPVSLEFRFQSGLVSFNCLPQAMSFRERDASLCNEKIMGKKESKRRRELNALVENVRPCDKQLLLYVHCLAAQSCQ